MELREPRELRHQDLVPVAEVKMKIGVEVEEVEVEGVEVLEVPIRQIFERRTKGWISFHIVV